MTPRPVDVGPTHPAAHPGWGGWVGPLRTRVAASADPAATRAAVLAAVVAQVAERAGWDPTGLRALGPPPDPDVAPAPADLVGPDLPGAVHEALLAPSDRRAAGAHYTPPGLASRLVAWALEGWADPGPGPLRVLDPAVGAGAFLLAAARHQHAGGASPGAVLAGLAGVDLDPGAVAAAEAALIAWARDEGWDGTGPGPTLAVADGTDPAPFGPDGPRPGQVDLVVGNPPFRGQLGRATARDRDVAARLRERWGDAAGGYVDDAALFLRIACAWPRPGGRVVLVQPESVLGARDADGVRRAVGEGADLVGLWVADEPAFAAVVDVCAPVLEVRAPGRPPTAGPVARAEGVAVRTRPPDPRPEGTSWAPLLARSRGVPLVSPERGTGTLGDLATATAGFRQHFYAVAPHLREAPPTVDVDPGCAPVLTTGLVDPLVLAWGERPARIAGRTWERPVVDLDAVEATATDVAAWVRARLRPKVVVAPQTRVVEAAVDGDGRFVPGVPLVSVEQRPDAGEDDALALWRLVAVLLAPPTSAWAMEQAAGTARNRDAVRLSARQVLAAPLPGDAAAWEAAALALRDGAAPVDVGPGLAGAYGLTPDHPVVAWWRGRLPGARPGRGRR